MYGVFSAATFGTLEVSNRLVVAPMTRISAEHEGEPTDLMEDYYARFAKGGFDLIISEGVYTDRKYSQCYQYQPGITDDSQQQAWAELVERVRSEGAEMICQLMHAGAQYQYNRFAETSKAPSEVAPKGEPIMMYGKGTRWLRPEPLDDADYNQILNGFVGAAKRAKAAGFAGVELHAADGYLLNEMLSTYFNERKDMWGGNLDNRLRFLIMLVKAVRDAVGEDYLLGMRISQFTLTDPDYQWPEGEEGFRYMLEKLRDAGLSYVHTADVSVNRKALNESDKSLAEVAQEIENLELIVNGGVNEVNAEDIAEQYPDALLAIGKKALANPDFADRLRSGDEIADLDSEMLEPRATIQHELNWRKINT